MVWNILHISVMALAFLYVFNKTEFSRNRIVALVPLAMMVLDVCSAQFDFWSVPVLAVILVAMRMTVIGCCIAAVRRDRAMVRARQRQRTKARMVMRTAAIERKPSNVYEMPQYA